MSIDLTLRLSALGAVLAERMPLVLEATISVLESIPPVPDAARPERYEIEREIGAGGMSPEQASQEELDGRSNLFAVGMVLWKLLAHERIRFGLCGHTSLTAALYSIRHPSEYRQGIPADLEAVARSSSPTVLPRTTSYAARTPPRDGRGELVRLLDERFPRSRGRRPLSHPPESSRSTETGSHARPGAPPVLPPWERVSSLSGWRTLALSCCSPSW